MLFFLDLESIFAMNRPDPNRPDTTRPDTTRPVPTRANPARPWRYLTAYYSNMLEDASLKLIDNLDTGLQIVVIMFHRDVSISYEVIALFGKTDFCYFYIYFCV